MTANSWSETTHVRGQRRNVFKAGKGRKTDHFKNKDKVETSSPYRDSNTSSPAGHAAATLNHVCRGAGGGGTRRGQAQGWRPGMLTAGLCVDSFLLSDPLKVVSSARNRNTVVWGSERGKGTSVLKGAEGWAESGGRIALWECHPESLDYKGGRNTKGTATITTQRAELRSWRRRWNGIIKILNQRRERKGGTKYTQDS